MNNRIITLVLVLLFLPLFIALVAYSIRLNPKLNRLFTPRQVLEDQQLSQQMKTFKRVDSKLVLSPAISGGDAEYGGNVINGVLTDLSTVPISIKNRDGKEIAKSIMTFTIKYLDSKNTLQTMNLSAGFQLPDGTYHGMDWVPIRLPNSTVNSQRYEDKIGTAVFALFRISTSKAIQTIKGMGKTAEEISEAEKVFTVIDEYEKSWKNEMDQLILGGNKGKLEFLFPITYLPQSFDTSFGNFLPESKR